MIHFSVIHPSGMNHEQITLKGTVCQCISIPTRSSLILLIQTPSGDFLGCGYFDIATAGKLGERVALVRGVSSFEDMLNREVVELSPEAEKAGLRTGETGRVALEKLIDYES